MNHHIVCLKIQVREFCSDYLNLKSIDECFQKAGFKEVTNKTLRSEGVRRGLVEDYYSSENWHSKETIQKFYNAIRNILCNRYINQKSRKILIQQCQELGFNIEDFEDFYLGTDIFSKQFPSGLPFGKIKPAFAVKAQQGRQKLNFELSNGLGIIQNNVYPNFTYKKLAESYNLIPGNNDGSLQRKLYYMNQTQCEEDFFLEYANLFKMFDTEIPVLIPQAWIQWHSFPKHKLLPKSALQQDDIYRVDFVAFWNNKRFAIEIDDISHYGVLEKNLSQNNQNYWLANEIAYSKTLKNTRSLMNEHWQVLRFSNSDLRDKDLILKAVNEVRCFLEF